MFTFYIFRMKAKDVENEKKNHCRDLLNVFVLAYTPTTNIINDDEYKQKLCKMRNDYLDCINNL
jgi:hypothetical protein